ncbi:hypothetical protein HaLaN_32167, partial [Haematococcus lacustris]
MTSENQQLAYNYRELRAQYDTLAEDAAELDKQCIALLQQTATLEVEKQEMANNMSTLRQDLRRLTQTSQHRLHHQLVASPSHLHSPAD